MNPEPFFREIKQRLSQLLPHGTTYQLRCDVGIMVSAQEAEELRPQLQQFSAELQAATDKGMQAAFAEAQDEEKAPKNGSHPARPTPVET